MTAITSRLHVRWETPKQQMNNTSWNVKVTVGDEIRTISEWSKIVGISPGAFAERLERWKPGDLLARSGTLRHAFVIQGQKTKTHCKRGHSFSGENLRIDRNDVQICLTCYIARYKSAIFRRSRLRAEKRLIKRQIVDFMPRQAAWKKGLSSC